MANAVEVYGEGAAVGLKPEPEMTVTRWADERRILPRGSAEAGPWRTDRTPYLREIMDGLSPSDPVQKIKVQKGTQLGFTEAGNNWFGFIIELCPDTTMMALPTDQDAKDHAKQKINPMIEEMPALRGLVRESKTKGSDTTTTFKDFTGGWLLISGAKTPRRFRQKSVRFAFADDIDGWDYEHVREGDLLALFENRTDAYGSRKKIYMVSTPTVHGSSRIETEIRDSDDRWYYVPCPFCKHPQILKWERIKFNRREYDLQGDAWYVCELCGKKIEEYHKTEMLSRGKWKAHNPGHEYRGYTLSSLYSPLGWLSWTDIAKDFLKAKQAKSQPLLKRWTNTRLAETWEEQGETIEDLALFSRREKYGPEVPEEAGVLVAGIDIQKDRVEIEVVAFGKGEESWSMDVRIVPGEFNAKAVQETIDTYLKTGWRHASGAMLRIMAVGIDSGDQTKEVYDFVRPRQDRNIFAMKGFGKFGIPIIKGPPKRLESGKVYLTIVGTDEAKRTIYGRLNQSEAGPGFMHFPWGYDEEYFKQLTAEKVVTRFERGVAKRLWVKKRPRNEALDRWVYVLAALEILKTHHEFDLDSAVDYVRAAGETASGSGKAGKKGRRMVSEGFKPGGE